MNDKTCAMQLRGALRLAFLSTAGIGGSRKARLRALAHAMTHAHDSACIMKHAKLRISYMPCACACGMRHRRTRVFLCASCRWTRFFSAEQWARWDQRYLQTQAFTLQCMCMAGSADTAVPECTQISACCTEVTITKRTKSKREGDNNTQRS